MTIVTQRQYSLITRYLSVNNDDEYRLNGMGQLNQEALADLVEKGHARLVDGVYHPSKDILTLALQKKLQIEEFLPDLKRKKDGDKEYLFVVRETIQRDRHYYVYAKDADEAEKKMGHGPGNVVFKEEAPSNEKIRIDDSQVIELILPDDE